MLDVDALVALAWDSHVHHATMRTWFRRQQRERMGHVPDDREWLRAGVGQPEGAPEPIGVEAARAVLSALRAADGHRFLVDDVSVGVADVPRMSGYRQVTDAHLVGLARRQRVPPAHVRRWSERARGRA